MTAVRIYQPSKNALQSGKANTKKWVLEYEPESAKSLDPLMGWTSSGDTRGQVKMKFASRDDAIAFAKRKGFEYVVREPKARRIQIRNYADNFAFNRVK